MDVGLHVIIHLDLREQRHSLGDKTEGDVSTAVTAGAFDTFPILDFWHHDIHQLSQEMLHVLTSQFCFDSYRISPRSNSPWRNAALGFVCLDPNVRNRLHSHTCHMQPLGSFRGCLFDVAVDCDSLNFWNVSEGDGFPEQS